MSINILIPSQLRALAGDACLVLVSGSTVGAALADLVRQHPGMEARVLDEKKAIRRFVNVFVGDEDVRFLDGLETSVNDGDSIAIVPAVAGG